MDNTKLLKNLFGSMQEAIFLGDPLLEGRFACFMQPGELIPTTLQENANSKDMFLQSSFCNKVIDTSIVNRFDRVGFGGNKELLGSVDEIYENALNRCSLPHRDLTPEEERQLQRARDALALRERAYLFHQREVEYLEFALNVERAKQKPSTPLITDLRKKLQRARRAWEINGYRAEYEQAYADLLAISAVTPRRYVQQLKERLDIHRGQDVEGNQYLQTFLSLPISSWGQIQWNRFEVKVAESDHYNYSKSTSWSGGASGRWGLWSIGGQTSGSEVYTHEKTSASTISLKFDYITVRILRDWMRETFLYDRFWTWKKAWPGRQLLSDGGALHANPPVRPVGTMPVLVNTLVIARNVEISGDFSESEMTHYRKEVQNRASVGWGPFSVSGSYRSVTQMDHVVGSIGDNTIRMNHPQIIAKMGVLLPRCPNPDLTLPFDPNDAWLPGSQFNDESSPLAKRARAIDAIARAQFSDQAAMGEAGTQDELDSVESRAEARLQELGPPHGGSA